MKLPIATNEQYKIIVYALRTYRFMYIASQSTTYLAKYHELAALLYTARVNGQFLVIDLSFPSVISFKAAVTETTCLTKVEILDIRNLPLAA